MDLIIGMDAWVFTAWILTIISAIFCVIYGVYHEIIKKHKETKPHKEKKIKKEVSK